MHRLSSNSTLFWKLFLPIMYAVFFGLFGVSILVLDPYDMPYFSKLLPRLIYFGLYFAMLTFFWFTIADLKRVEYKDDFMYVTNYIKSYKYPINSVRIVKEYDLFLFKLVSLHMLSSTSLGSKIRFISSGLDLKDFKERIYLD